MSSPYRAPSPPPALNALVRAARTIRRLRALADGYRRKADQP